MLATRWTWKLPGRDHNAGGGLLQKEDNLLLAGPSEVLLNLRNKTAPPEKEGEGKHKQPFLQYPCAQGGLQR